MCGCRKLPSKPSADAESCHWRLRATTKLIHVCFAKKSQHEAAFTCTAYDRLTATQDNAWRIAFML